MKFKKALTLVLCAAMTLPLFSCAPKEPPKKDVPDAGKDEIIDSIPEGYNLQGETFGILHPPYLEDYLIGDNEATDIVYSRIYERNIKVEQRLNCKLNPINNGSPAWQDLTSSIINCVQQMDDTIQMIFSGSNSVIQMGQISVFQNLNDSEFIDIEQPWWYKDCIMELSVDNYYYRFLYGDNYISSLTSAGAIFYNKDLYGEYVDPGNPEGLYQHVFNGTWTIEQFSIESANSYVNMGGENDIHGYSLFRGAEPIHHFVIGADVEFYKRDQKGFPVITVYNDKSIDVCDKLYKLLYQNKGAWLFFPNQLGEEVYHTTDFMDRKVMFVLEGIGAFLNDDMREMEDAFGLLPYPKYNVEQEEYISMLHNSASLMGIPISVKVDYAMGEVSAVLEAVASEGYKTVKDAFYDQACKRAFSRDDTTAEMLDIITGRHPTIKSKLVKNFLYEYRNYCSKMGVIFTLVLQEGPKGTSTIASIWEANEEAAHSQLNKLIEDYLKEGN